MIEQKSSGKAQSYADMRRWSDEMSSKATEKIGYDTNRKRGRNRMYGTMYKADELHVGDKFVGTPEWITGTGLKVAVGTVTYIHPEGRYAIITMENGLTFTQPLLAKDNWQEPPVHPVEKNESKSLVAELAGLGITLTQYSLYKGLYPTWLSTQISRGQLSNADRAEILRDAKQNADKIKTYGGKNIGPSANVRVRAAFKTCGISQMKFARHIGISKNALQKRLATEMLEEAQDEMIAAIEQAASEIA